MASVEKRGDSYRIVSSCGYATNGRKVRKSMTWTPAPGMTERQIEKELKRQVVLFDERVQSGQFLDANTKFKDFADKWMGEYSEAQHKDKTIATNYEALSRINAGIGHIKLCNLQPHHILEYLRQLGEPGQNKKTGGCLSAKTISNHLRIISSILSTAVQWQAIPYNPARNVKAPKIVRNEIKCFDDMQTIKVLAALENEPIRYRTAIELLIFTGARRGEILGLTWDDIDNTNCTVSINKSSLYLPDKGIYTTTPKNESSNRVIKIPADVIARLRKYKIFQTEERLKCGDQWEGTGHIFTQWNGRPLHPDSLSGWFKKFIARYNANVDEKETLPNISIHELRHPHVKPGLKIFLFHNINFFHTEFLVINI